MTNAHPLTPAGSKAHTEEVILVDENDRAIGTETKLAAHRGEGRLHRAFSVFIVDERGRMLLQRRAEGKYHFGGRWTNACCGHPRPSEAVEDAASRRLWEEMRVSTELDWVARFTYHAFDEGSQLIENEIDHVFLGVLDQAGDMEITPDPLEASAFRWLTLSEIDAELHADPEAFTPWFPLALRALREVFPNLGTGGQAR